VGISTSGGAQSGAPGSKTSGAEASKGQPSDPNLARLIEAWPNLSDPIRLGILAIVNAALPKSR
jgi:hypothetical protein